MSHDVICALPHIPDQVTEILTPLGCQLRVVPLQTLAEEEFCREIATAVGIVAGGEYYTPNIFRAARNLKIVARHGVGVDHVDLEAAARHGVWVTNTPGATNQAVAEFTIGLILNLLRHIPNMASDMKKGVATNLQGEEFGRLTIGVIGAGGIGKEVLRLSRGFGARAVAYDVYPDQPFADTLQVEYVSLEELLRQADIVTIHCGLDESTQSLIGESQLKLMKSSAYLVNTGRPAIVDKQALIASLESRTIAGAAIDVWDTIPPPADDPLLRLDNLLATPWAAFNTKTAVKNMCHRAAEEIARVVQGQRPLHAVNSPTF